MTAILAGVISYLAWSWQFDRYIKNKLQDTADYIASSASEAYATFGSWSFAPIAVIPQIADRADVIVQLLDTNGVLIYSEGMPDQNAGTPPFPLLGGGWGNTNALLNQEGRVQVLEANNDAVTTSPVLVNGIVVGEVRVGAYGSGGLLTAHDLQMRTSSLFALGAAGFIAIIGATIMGAFYARRLVRPIRQVTAAAQALREGDEDARSGLSGDDEIAQLGITFDHMAAAVQHDRQRERRLTGDVAHELRTPLMGIQATVEAIEDGIYPPDNQHLSIISRETRRLSGLTNTILELSRLENPSEQFAMQRIDINEPVSASIDLHTALLEASDLRLDVSLEPELYVLGNAEKLQQAVGNFLANAARYTETGGIVTVRSFADERWAAVSIADTGIGISPEDLDRIFARFWRADAARSRSSGGIGVGLTIVKEIVDRHRGEIAVASEQGKGTTFTIRLPRVAS
jgi:signal transduction histidine kinase